MLLLVIDWLPIEGCIMGAHRLHWPTPHLEWAPGKVVDVRVVFTGGAKCGSMVVVTSAHRRLVNFSPSAGLETVR
jgi:hypothetical protein